MRSLVNKCTWIRELQFSQLFQWVSTYPIVSPINFACYIFSSAVIEDDTAELFILLIVRRRPSVRLSVNNYTFIFFSETTTQNGFKIDLQVPWVVLSQICKFRVDISIFVFLVNILGHLVKIDIFDFFFKTASQNASKFDIQLPWVVLSQICSFLVKISIFVFLVNILGQK